MTRSAREVVELYNLVVWNERNFDLAEELMGDSVIRHDVGESTVLTHEQAVARIVDHWEMFETIRFDLNLVVAGDDGEHVAIVYQSPMELKDGTKTDVGSMEIFRVVDGRIVEVWNCGYKQGSLAVTERVLNELGYYLLAGAGGEGPAGLMDEARRGEELGFGTGFISERWNVKEASSLTGAALAVTNRMQIATAATNHNTRHPLITGSYATTMHRLSKGRFTLGIGRGVAAMYGAFGVPAVTTAQMEDFAQVMRRLWHGELVFNHDGPIGQVSVAVPGSGLQRGHPARDRGVRSADAGAGRSRVRRRHPAHLLHARDAAARGQDRQGRRGAGGPQSRRREGVVVLRDGRRPSARGTPAEEDGGAAGDLSAGLWRTPGQHQRLGSLSAATLQG